MPFLAADEVEAPVDAVGAIDVGAPRRPEHRGVALGRAAEAVRGRVVAIVGLGLDDAAADAVDQQRDADQQARDLMRGRGEVDGGSRGKRAMGLHAAHPGHGR
ncbi:hypothetical protein LJR290_005707 [Variovorax sp. LjRoot290]|uniref:hypothetical protein n=1 Tax=Variovorax sp. LjRoot290 TaxID=3342316 RepID=UPI003ECC72A4